MAHQGDLTNLYNVCAVHCLDIISALGNVISILGDIITALGVYSALKDIMICVGDIINALGDIMIDVGDIISTLERYHDLCKAISLVHWGYSTTIMMAPRL